MHPFVHVLRTLASTALALPLIFLAVSTAPHAAAQTTAIGTNLASLTDGSTDEVFQDAWKRSRDWRTRNADGSGPWDSNLRLHIPRDADGWPTQVPFTPPGGVPQIVHSILDLREAGAYTLRYQGKGRLKFSSTNGGATLNLTVTAPGWKQHTYTVALNADGKATAYLEIFETDPADPLRGFEFVSPGRLATYQTQPFHPAFLDRLAGMKLLRLMDWQRANLSPLAAWSARTRPETNTQNRPEGVALEYQADLANALDADLWITLPHLADDAFVANTAALLRDRLEPARKLYVEYSNETWNTAAGFGNTGTGQTWHVAEAAKTRRAAGQPYSTNDYTAGQQYAAVRSAEIWALFETAFGPAASRDRLVRVLAAQSGNSTIASTRLAALADPALNPAGLRPDVLAIAPYFGNPVANQASAAGESATITVAELLSRTEAHLDTAVPAQLAAHIPLASAHGLWLVAYEGGQHLAGTGGVENDALLAPKLIAANRDETMYSLYRDYLAYLRSADIAVFANFSFALLPSKFGSWGVLDTVYQPTAAAPKFRALLDEAAQFPAANRPPRLRGLPASLHLTDTNGDGAETVSLDASAARDIDGVIASVVWTLAGQTLATGYTANLSLPVGEHVLVCTATDDDGATASVNIPVSIAPQGADQPLVTASLTGTAPAQNLPWTATSALAAHVSYSGLSRGSGIVPNSRADSLGFVVNAPATAEASTLAQAINDNEFWSFTVAPLSDRLLDLRGATLTLTVRRLGEHAPRAWSLLSSRDGFTASAALATSATFTQTNTAQTIVFRLPFVGWSELASPVEFRLYPHGGQFYGHEIAIEALALTGAVRPPPLLAHEPFDYSAGTLAVGTGAGAVSGWDTTGWLIQNNSTAFSVATATPPTVTGLVQSVSHLKGGSSANLARGLDLSSSGPFAPHISGGLIGAPGQTLWFAAVLRKESANDERVFVNLNGNSVLTTVNTTYPSIGYFGTSGSNVSGQRRWSLRVGGAVYPSALALTPGTPSLLVGSVTYAAAGSPHTVRLWINPPAGANPGTPAIETTTTADLRFRAVAAHLGAANQGALDEIRLGATYGSVAP